MLSERSQTEKPYTASFHLHIMYRIGKSIDTYSLLPEAGEESIRKFLLMGMAFFLGS